MYRRCKPIAVVSEGEEGSFTSGASKLPKHLRTLGDFQILREIGRGGMGVVYEAQQISLGRHMALKVLPFAGVLDHRQLQRFKHEAQAAALLHHQNIVPVHGIGSDRGVHFYAMQHIEGQTLAEVISDLRRLEGLEGDKESPDCRTLYEMSTLHPIFIGTDRQELMKQIAFDEPWHPRKLNRFLPAEMETIIVKGLEKSPEHRYDSARQLADDFHRFLEDKPIHASHRRSCKGPPSGRVATSRLSVSAAVVLVLATLGLAISSLLLAHGAMWRKPPEKANNGNESEYPIWPNSSNSNSTTYGWSKRMRRFLTTNSSGLTGFSEAASPNVANRIAALLNGITCGGAASGS